MTFFSNIRLQSLVFFALAFLLYINTLGHGFVQDDQVVITENRLVQKGLRGIPELVMENSFEGYLPEGTSDNLLTGGRYRPLSMVFFAVLVQFFGNSSLVFHLFAVLLYALTCLLLYRTLLLALKPTEAQLPAALLAWGTTLLFVVHPVHTEVVANVKSCDEQLALLAGLGTLFSVLKFFDTRRRSWMVGAGLLFFAACMAKETAVSILLIAPAALWIFRDFGQKQRLVLATLLPLALAFGLYFIARGLALDWQFAGQIMQDPLNNPFLALEAEKWAPFTAAEKSATILYTLFEYARLLVWPHPLTHDYYPFQIEAQNFGSPWVWGGIILYTLILILGIWGLIKKNKIAFGLLFYVVPLVGVANIFFPVGTFMAERFLFMPSVGFCFAFVAALVWLTRRFGLTDRIVVAAVVLPAIVFSILTLLRNPAWESNKTLLQTDLATSDKSAKLRNSLGTLILSEALQSTNPTERTELLKAAETDLKQAIVLHPTYYDAILAYGACTFYLGNYEQSANAYRAAGQMYPQDEKTKTGLFFALRYGGDYYLSLGQNPEQGLWFLQEAWQIQPDTAVATHLAAHFIRTDRPDDAVEWMEKAVALAPGDQRLIELLSKAYLVAGQPEKAKAVFEQKQSFQTLPPAGNK